MACAETMQRSACPLNQVAQLINRARPIDLPRPVGVRATPIAFWCYPSHTLIMQYTAGLTAKWSSCADGEDVPEVVLDRFFQLLVRAGVRITVGSPADELRGVPEPVALHVLVTDFDH